MICPMIIANNPVENPKDAKYVPVKISAKDSGSKPDQSVFKIDFFYFIYLCLLFHSSFKSNAWFIGPLPLQDQHICQCSWNIVFCTLYRNLKGQNLWQHLARFAAIALKEVHPVPCVFGLWFFSFKPGNFFFLYIKGHFASLILTTF